ncbi:DNA ligase 1, partial [Tanacetum coccineum]
MISSSSRERSAFDALMSNARAAAAYKKSKPPPTSSFSSKKRKTITLNSKTEGLDSGQPEGPESKKTLVSKSSISEKTKTLGSKTGSNSELNLGFSRVGSELNKLPVDESITQLKVKPVKFDPKKTAYWGEGESVPFLFLVRVFDEISKESGRIVITEILCNMLRTVIHTTPEDL